MKSRPMLFDMPTGCPVFRVRVHDKGDRIKCNVYQYIPASNEMDGGPRPEPRGDTYKSWTVELVKEGDVDVIG